MQNLCFLEYVLKIKNAFYIDNLSQKYMMKFN